MTRAVLVTGASRGIGRAIAQAFASQGDRVAVHHRDSAALAEEVVADLDVLLMMTVNPGFGGQTYLPAGNEKIRRARDLLSEHGSRAFLEVDGGITTHTIAAAHAAGADTFVAGNAVFTSSDPGAEVRALRQRCLVTV